MDIGTGKDLADYNIDGTSIPYHLIDIVEAGSKYDLHRYQRDFASSTRSCPGASASSTLVAYSPCSRS